MFSLVTRIGRAKEVVLTEGFRWFNKIGTSYRPLAPLPSIPSLLSRPLALPFSLSASLPLRPSVKSFLDSFSRSRTAVGGGKKKWRAGFEVTRTAEQRTESSSWRRWVVVVTTFSIYYIREKSTFYEDRRFICRSIRRVTSFSPVSDRFLNQARRVRDKSRARTYVRSLSDVRAADRRFVFRPRIQRQM